MLHAATLGSLKPHSVGTPRPYETLSYRGSLHRNIRVGMAAMELSGAQGPLKGVGFQPQVDLAHRKAAAKLIALHSIYGPLKLNHYQHYDRGSVFVTDIQTEPAPVLHVQ